MKRRNFTTDKGLPEELQFANFGSTFGRKDKKRQDGEDSARGVMSFSRQSPKMNHLRKMKTFDWACTEIYAACQRVPRFKRPLIKDARTVEVIHLMKKMKDQPEEYDEAYELSGPFHLAIALLHDLLCLDLAMPELFEKIKRA